MEVLLVLIGLMLLTVFVVAIGDKIGLPWPALLTIITACAVFVPGLPQFEPPTELILPIFLPPLLWALARRTSWGVIREQWVTILSLSVLLVVATTLAVGFTAYAFLPGISLAAAILIGAAIAPPDPVAVDAVAEPAAAVGDVAMIPGSFTWDDVGDFAAIARLNPVKDASGITVIGDTPRVYSDDASGVVVTDTKRVIALIGIEDVVVVDTEDALLVTTTEHAQEVKKAVEALKAEP